MITVTASWIFNRLCDEPARLQKEFDKRMAGRPITSFAAFSTALIDYENIAAMESQVAKMRTDSYPNIEVVNDTPHIKASTK